MSISLRRSILLLFVTASAFAVVVIVEGEKRRERFLPGKWYHLTPIRDRSNDDSPIEMLKDGSLTDGDVSSTWSYFNGDVTMSPQSGPDTVYVLSEDGKRLTGKVVKDFVYEKRP
jgi:hypothetical protein